jgi:hypothetical protein
MIAMRTTKSLVGSVLFLALTVSTASAQVQLSIRDGRVTLAATNATVRQILTEWARVGQTRVVNVERIPGGPLTLQLTNVSEQEALDILLRSVTGYMAAPRAVPVANLSHYDRILVLPTAAVPRVAVAAAPTPVLQRQAPQQAVDDGDDQPSIVQPPRGPLFQTFPQGPLGSPQAGAASSTPGALPPQQPTPNGPAVEQLNGQPIYAAPFSGGAAVGTPRPGMVVPAPAQPGVILPGQSGQPVPPPNH